MMEDEIKTIRSIRHAETKIKGSKFIATASPAAKAEHALEFIKGISKQFHDATHNCSAFKIGFGDSLVTRCNDDGEPSGTAGKSILSAIETRSLTNLALVVTRYFGGTKLGTGGLARAYSAAAKAALDEVEVIAEKICDEIEFSYPYFLSNAIGNLIGKFDAGIISSTYEETVGIKVVVQQGHTECFLRSLREVTNGRVTGKIGTKLLVQDSYRPKR